MSTAAKPVVLVDEISSDLAKSFIQHLKKPEVTNVVGTDTSESVKSSVLYILLFH
jgi:hypothetical protein